LGLGLAQVSLQVQKLSLHFDLACLASKRLASVAWFDL